jgi:hypothetical protein
MFDCEMSTLCMAARGVNARSAYSPMPPQVTRRILANRSAFHLQSALSATTPGRVLRPLSHHPAGPRTTYSVTVRCHLFNRSMCSTAGRRRRLSGMAKNVAQGAGQATGRGLLNIESKFKVAHWPPFSGSHTVTTSPSTVLVSIFSVTANSINTFAGRLRTDIRCRWRDEI